jgi:formylglycine-generating enzyme required for sulfatase activity/energy-coupling factor transporter ATP-binding protein EcfA2
MEFDIPRWKREIEKRLIGWQERMQQAGGNSIYYFLSGISLIPILNAVRDGDWSALLALSAGIGANLVANQLQNLKDAGDEVELADRLQELAKIDPNVQKDLDLILQKLEVISLADQVISYKDKDWFIKVLRDEIQSLGSVVEYNAVISGDVVLAQGKNSLAIGENTVIVEEGSKDNIVIAGKNHSIYAIFKQYLGDKSIPQNSQRLQDQIRGYLNWVCDRFGTIELHGIKREGHQVVQLDFEKVYVPLCAYDSGREILLNQVLSEGDRLVITGGPGCGKTTVLLYIAYILSIAIPGENEQFSFEKIGIPFDEKKSLEKLRLDCQKLGTGDTETLEKVFGNLDWLYKYDIESTLEKLRTKYKDLDDNEKFALVKTGVNFHFLEENETLPLPVFIPLGAYAEYLRKLPFSTEPQKKTLASFISYYLIEKQTGFDLPNDFFERLLIDGRSVLLLLDGLDEVPDEGERAKVREAIDTLVTGRRNLRVIVTCRVAAYQGRTALRKGFKEIQVNPLELKHISKLVHLAYENIFPNENLAKQKAADLMLSIQKLETERCKQFGVSTEPLITTPLLVRMLLIVHYSERRLPEQRAELYLKATDELLLPEYNLDESINERIGRMVGGSLQIHRDMAQFIAFSMHKRGSAQGREISEDILRAILKEKPEYSDFTDDLIALTRTRGTLLEERLGQYRFIHLGFQEFLAARYLAEVIRSEAGIDRIATFFEEGLIEESWWHEAALLTVGYLSIVSPNAAELLIKRFIGLDEKANQRSLDSSTRIAEAEVAGNALFEWVSSSPAFRKMIIQQLGRLFQNEEIMNSTNPAFRLALGDSLALLGDPRFRDSSWFLPDEPLLGFVCIPSSEFLMGSNQLDSKAHEKKEHRLFLPEFYIGRYPVTVGQFKNFVRDSRYSRHSKESLSDPLNRPVRFVKWYDAVAYCKWLDKKLREWGGTPEPIRSLLKNGWQVTLPSEAQWEKAARGEDGRMYPWGNSFDESLANTEYLPIRTTSTIGCFPAGASPYGLQDMCGNVWEWTRTKWGKYQNSPEYCYPYDQKDGREEMKGNKYEHRVVRGGSFNTFGKSLYCAYRHKLSPNLWDKDFGFRIVISQS